MTGVFSQDDLQALWEQGPDFLPRRPPAGSHRWRLDETVAALRDASVSLDASQAERRVALMIDPSLPNAAATDGLNAGIQLLLPGEHAAVHRHSPSALRVGLTDIAPTTLVDDQQVPLERGDVVLNPSGTWHGHTGSDDQPSAWLDVVDLPIVTALGGVLFDPSLDQSSGALLDPPATPPVIRFPWSDVTARLDAVLADPPSGGPDVGVAEVAYGEVLPTMAVTAYQFRPEAELRLPPRTAGAIAVVVTGAFVVDDELLTAGDVVALRSWTPFTARGQGPDARLLVVDSSPALRSLGLFRQELDTEQAAP